MRFETRSRLKTVRPSHEIIVAVVVVAVVVVVVCVCVCVCVAGFFSESYYWPTV